MPTGCSGEHGSGGSKHGTGHGDLDRAARGRAGRRVPDPPASARRADTRHRHQCRACLRSRRALLAHERAGGKRRRWRATRRAPASSRRLAAIEPRARGQRRARGDCVRGARERAGGERALDPRRPHGVGLPDRLGRAAARGCGRDGSAERARGRKRRQRDRRADRTRAHRARAFVVGARGGIRE